MPSDGYQFAYFFRKMEPHSVLIKVSPPPSPILSTVDFERLGEEFWWGFKKAAHRATVCPPTIGVPSAKDAYCKTRPKAKKR